MNSRAFTQKFRIGDDRDLRLARFIGDHVGHRISGAYGHGRLHDQYGRPRDGLHQLPHDAVDGVHIDLPALIARGGADTNEDRVRVLDGRVKVGGEGKPFTADAAHELRTPLTALQLQLANLCRAKSDAGRQEHTDKLQEGMDRVANVVRQLLALARVEPDAAEHTMAPVHLSVLARDVLMGFAQEAIEKHIDLGMQRADAVQLHGSAENLRILLENLVSNALRYTPDGGRVNISVYQEQDVAVLEVQDNGIGIPEAERSRVFERFYRVLGSDAEGSGLGLSIAQNVVEQHRGTIHVQDGADNRGVTFIVRLPLV